MKIYQTNAALGYQQLAFLIKIKGRDHDYLCIGTQNNDYYKIGEVVKDLEDLYLEETTYELTDSPLHGSFLFDHWISTLE